MSSDMHYRAAPGKALCGLDEPNSGLTDSWPHVTCWRCADLRRGDVPLPAKVATATQYNPVDWRYIFMRSLGLLGGLVAECRARNVRSPASISPTYLAMCQNRIEYWWALLAANGIQRPARPGKSQPPNADTSDQTRMPGP